MSSAVKIIAIGTYLPQTRQSNYPQAEKFGYDSNFLEKKLGFKSIALKDPAETVPDMCLRAFGDLQCHIDVDPKKIDLLTVVSQNPTLRIPHTSAIVHNLLGLDKNCMTFDISQGCAGFCHALEITTSLMQALQYDNALLFTCDPYRDIIDTEDRNVSMVFGDGAAVTLLSQQAGPGYRLVDATFGTVPNSYDCLITKDNILRMDGQRVFNYAAKEVPQSIELLLKRNDLLKEDIDLFLLHQGSKFIIDSLIKLMCITPEQTEFAACEYGNTVSSSLPILFSRHFGAHAKSKVILSGFGVGFTWGTCLLTYMKN